MGEYAEPIREEWVEAVARNAAAAPPFSAATLEKLAVILGPAAARSRRRPVRRKPPGKK